MRREGGKGRGKGRTIELLIISFVWAVGALYGVDKG